MSPIQVIVVGTGGEARRVLDLLESEPLRHVAIGCVTGPDPVDSDPSGGGNLAHLGRFDGPALLTQSCQYAVLALEQPWARHEALAHLNQIGMPALTLVHPRAILSSSSTIGAGAVIHAGAIIEADVSVGPGARIGSLCTLGIGCRIGDNAFLAHGVHCGASSRLGEGVAVGSGTVIGEAVLVGPDSLIGPCSLVTENLLAGSRMWETGTAEREFTPHPEIDQS